MWLEPRAIRRRVGTSGRKVNGCWIIEGLESQAKGLGFVPVAVAGRRFDSWERHGQVCVLSSQSFSSYNVHPNCLGSC